MSPEVGHGAPRTCRPEVGVLGGTPQCPYCRALRSQVPWTTSRAFPPSKPLRPGKQDEARDPPPPDWTGRGQQPLGIDDPSATVVLRCTTPALWGRFPSPAHRVKISFLGVADLRVSVRVYHCRPIPVLPAPGRNRHPPLTPPSPAHHRAGTGRGRQGTPTPLRSGGPGRGRALWGGGGEGHSKGRTEGRLVWGSSPGSD